jgi:copper transport protein
VGIVASGVALGAAPAAFAHATLVSTTPADGAVLKRSPPRVSVRFDETVSTPFDALRVLDSDGKRIDTGRDTRPAADEVAVALSPSLPRGTYTVAWRVTSADTHPVHGAFVFSVGKPSGDAGAVGAAALARDATPRHVSLGFGVVRFLRLTLVLLAAGAALMLALAPLGRRVELAAAGAAAALVPVALAGLVYDGAAASGFGLVDAGRWRVVETVLQTRFGVVWMLQVGLAVVLAVALLARRRVVAAVAGVVLAGATTAAAHASADGIVAIVADGAHVVAAAAWFGGLAATALALAAARGERWPLAAQVVPRFSLLATGAVAVLIAAGVVSAYLELGAWRGLWDTTYGRLVLIKVGLLLPVLALGAFNNRVSVPGLRVELAAVRRRFVQAAAAELVLLTGILTVTAALVQEPPAKAQVVRSGPFATTTHLGPYELDLTVDPARTGANDIHLYLLRHSGQPANADEARLYASLPAAGIGPIHYHGAAAGPGHYAFNQIRLPVPGTWALRFEVRFGSFDQYETTVDVPIRKD